MHQYTNVGLEKEILWLQLRFLIKLLTFETRLSCFVSVSDSMRSHVWQKDLRLSLQGVIYIASGVTEKYYVSNRQTDKLCKFQNKENYKREKC